MVAALLTGKRFDGDVLDQFEQLLDVVVVGAAVVVVVVVTGDT